MGEGGGYVGGVSFDEVEGLGGGACGGGSGGEWDTGEAEEGDGRVGGGDAVDVGVDGRVVEEASGEEDGDGDGVIVVCLEKLCKFHHGKNVAYAWCRVQYYCVFLCHLWTWLGWV